MSRIPITDLRLQPYITITVPGAGENGASKTIGAISKISWDVARDTAVRRQLNADDADPGLGIEVYPKSLPTYTLTISKVVLYKESFMEAFGQTAVNEGYDILGQRRAVDIEVKLHEPTAESINNAALNQVASDNSKVTVVIKFIGVWFDKLPMAFDIDGDMKMEQEVTGKAAYVTVTRGA
jgi:hypothetical protein